MKLSYDMHLHSCLSPCADDDMTPANIAGMAFVAGLDVIALTDHNTCKNCPAIMQAAGQYGITVLCGMELCTSEEVHVLCYFPDLDAALSFDDCFFKNFLPDIKNEPSYFGRQIIYNRNDEPDGELERFLIGACDIPFSGVDAAIRPYGGIMVPAHIDKQSNSLISNLGFVPEGSTFHIAELHDINNRGLLVSQHPYLEHCRFLTSSDAHQLNDINEPINFLEAEARTAEAVYDSLKMQ